MTIDETIVTLQAILKQYPPRLFKTDKRSLRLAIEALKRLKWERQFKALNTNLLPGETKE